MLDAFDARRRPIALVYAPISSIAADDVPSRFVFTAAPGERRAPQPVRVLLNMRLSLPPGAYRATVRPKPGDALSGTIGLHLGRLGPSFRDWTADLPPGTPWQQEFTLPVDMSFVGLRTTPEFEAHVASMTIEPVRVVNESDRVIAPLVLAAVDYDGVAVAFHDETVYPERAGFWVRGRSTLRTTFATPQDPLRAPGVRLTLHGGPVDGGVAFNTPMWGTRVRLRPGERSSVTIPAAPGQHVIPVEITTESGFVPADVGGGADRRLLGCWVEVLE
jgi:hypothetical protein